MKRVLRTESIESELSNNAIRSSLLKKNYKHAWTEVIYSSGPYACFLTIQFQRSYPDSVTIPSVNQFFYNLNRQVFGRRWFRKKWGFTGMVIAEQNKSRAATAGDLHFHCLLHPNDYLKNIKSDYDLYPLNDQALVSMKKLVDSKGRNMCSIYNGVDIRFVHDLSGVTAYVTKEFDDSACETGDQIYFLDYQGLQAGCLDQWRKRAC